jgi:hypothetical protein
VTSEADSFTRGSFHVLMIVVDARSDALATTNNADSFTASVSPYFRGAVCHTTSN